MEPSNESHLEHIDYAQRNLPVHTVTSADGTTIAYEKSGTGPPVVIVGGGLNEKAMHAELADGLAAHFTVYNYDRRARGASDDRLVGPYSVDREIEDLAAVMGAAGEPCHVFANCTGAMIAIPAATRGLPLARLAMYEPPFGGPKVEESFHEELADLLAQDRRTEAIALFLTSALFTDEAIERLKTHPIWPAFEAMAQSTPYDSFLSAGAAELPVDELARVTVPTLVLGGEDSPDWMKATCQGVADGVRSGRFTTMSTAGHLMDDKAGAELLTEFFRDASVERQRPAVGAASEA